MFLQLNPYRPFAGIKYQGGLKGILITVICIGIFVRLGFWQYHKAQDALAKRAHYDAFVAAPPIDWPSKINDLSSLEYRTVRLQGRYLTEFMFYLDNQFDQGQPGFHVYVPMQLSASQHLLLVNLGWHPANAKHAELPSLTLTKDEIIVNGRVTLPSTRHFDIQRFAFFPAKNQPQKIWQPVRQFLDLPEISGYLPQALQPVVIQALASPAAADDQTLLSPKFERHWPVPADRVATNLGYAYQWFGFSVATFLIFIVVNFKRQQSRTDNAA